MYRVLDQISLNGSGHHSWIVFRDVCRLPTPASSGYCTSNNHSPVGMEVKLEYIVVVRTIDKLPSNTTGATQKQRRASRDVCWSVKTKGRVPCSNGYSADSISRIQICTWHRHWSWGSQRSYNAAWGLLVGSICANPINDDLRIDIDCQHTNDDFERTCWCEKLLPPHTHDGCHEDVNPTILNEIENYRRVNGYTKFENVFIEVASVPGRQARFVSCVRVCLRECYVFFLPKFLSLYVHILSLQLYIQDA